MYRSQLNLLQRANGNLNGAGIVVLLIFVALLTAGLWWTKNSGSMRIAISKEQILERLSQKLPVTKTYLFAFEVTYDSPRIELVETSERIHAGLDVRVNISFLANDKPLHGQIDAAAGVRYAANEGAFYLTDPTIESLTLDGLPDEWAAKAKDLVAEGVRSYFNDNPVYELTERQSHRATKAVLKNLSIKNEGIILHLGPPDPGPDPAPEKAAQ